MDQKPAVVRRLDGVKPNFGSGGAVFFVDPPARAPSGLQSNYVATSYGLSTVLGGDDTFAVFLINADGECLDYETVYSEGEGPGWCLDLM